MMIVLNRPGNALIAVILFLSAFVQTVCFAGQTARQGTEITLIGKAKGSQYPQVEFIKGGNALLSVTVYGQAAWYNTTTGTQLRADTFSAAAGQSSKSVFQELANTQQGIRLATIGSNQALNVWDVDRKVLVLRSKEVAPESGKPAYGAFTPDGASLFTCAFNDDAGPLKITRWDLKHSRRSSVYTVRLGVEHALHVSPLPLRVSPERYCQILWTVMLH